MQDNNCTTRATTYETDCYFLQMQKQHTTTLIFDGLIIIGLIAVIAILNKMLQENRRR